MDRDLARALARDLATQIAARLSPVRWSLVAPEEESWTRDLPHEHRHEGDAAFRFVATDREGGAVVVRDHRERQADGGLAASRRRASDDALNACFRRARHTARSAPSARFRRSPDAAASKFKLE